MKKALVISGDMELAGKIESVMGSGHYVFTQVATFLTGLDHLVSESVDLTIIQLTSPWEETISALYPIRWVSDTMVAVVMYPGDERDKAHFLGVADACIWLPLEPHSFDDVVGGTTRRRKSELHAHTRKPFFYCRGLLVFPTLARVFFGDKEICPGRTDYDLLHYLIRNRDGIVSRDQILSNVWHTKRFVDSDKTVNTHIYALRRLLAEYTDEPFIVTVHGFGYIFVTERGKAGEEQLSS